MKSIRTDTNHSCVPIPCYILIVYSVYSILILIVYKISMYFTVCTNKTFCYTSIMYQSNCDIEVPLPITQRQSKMFSKYLFFSFLKSSSTCFTTICNYSNVLQLWVASPFPFYIVEEKRNVHWQHNQKALFWIFFILSLFQCEYTCLQGNL